MKNLRPKLRVALLSLAVTVGALEIGLRVAGYDPVRELLRGGQLALRPADNPELIYELTPGARGMMWDTEVAINRHGFRDRDYDVEKPTGTFRIACLGDSTTFGNRLALAQTWHEQLEERLADDGRAFEVLNMGVAGYSALQEAIWFEQYGARFDSDLVLVAYCVNDVASVSVSLDYITQIQNYGALLDWSRLYQWLVLSLDRRAHRAEMERARAQEEATQAPVSVAGDRELERLVRELRASLPDPGDSSEWLDTQHTYRLKWYLNPNRLGRLRHAFERLRAATEPRGVPVTLFVIPFLDEGEERRYAEAWRIVERIVHHEARRQGFEILPIRSHFDTVELRSVSRNLIHPNIAGHRLLGQIVEGYVREQAEGN